MKAAEGRITKAKTDIGVIQGESQKLRRREPASLMLGVN